jgi:ABC-type transport system substrate-binding protein
VVREELRDVGINVNLDGEERSAMTNKVFIDWNFDLWTGGVGTGPDPVIGVTPFYLSNRIVKSPYNNAAGYNNTKMDQLWAQVRTEVDDAKRKQLYWQIQDLQAQDLPMLWLLGYGNLAAYRNEFGGLHSWAITSMAELKTVWWTKGSAPVTTVTTAPTTVATSTSAPVTPAAPTLGTETVVAIIVVVVAAAAALVLFRKRKKPS